VCATLLTEVSLAALQRPAEFAEFFRRACRARALIDVALPLLAPRWGVQMTFTGTDTNAARASCIEACGTCQLKCIEGADDLALRNSSTSLLDLPDECRSLYLRCAQLCGLAAMALNRPEAIEPRLLRTLLRRCAAACLACEGHCAQKAAQLWEDCQRACRDCAERCDALLRSLVAREEETSTL
jgi:hypothetical protein